MEYFYQSSANKQKLKLIILGDTGVGKTTIVSRFTQRPLPGCIPTIGCNFSLLRFEATGTDPAFILDVWDTAGQERYHSILDLYFQNVDVCLLVYDVNDITSLVRLFEVWLPRYINSKYNNSSDYSHKIFYLVGNKDDEETVNPTTNQEIKRILNQHRAVIKQYQIRLWMVSALRDQYIDKLLEDIRQAILKDVIPHKTPTNPDTQKSGVVELVREANDEPSKDWMQYMFSQC